MATTKIDFYSKYATEHMEIDMDDKGLFCKVCSERHEHVSYTVRVDESQLVPVATSCNCPSKKPCKHMHIVNAFYVRIYKSNIAKAAESAKVEEVSPVVEQIAEEVGITVEQAQEIAAIALDYQQEIKPKHTDLCLPIGPRDTKKDWRNAALTKNSGFSILRKVG